MHTIRVNYVLSSLDANKATLAVSEEGIIKIPESIVQGNKNKYTLCHTSIKFHLFQKHLQGYENAQFLFDGLQFGFRLYYLCPLVLEELKSI